LVRLLASSYEGVRGSAGVLAREGVGYPGCYKRFACGQAPTRGMSGAHETEGQVVQRA